MEYFEFSLEMPKDSIYRNGRMYGDVMVIARKSTPGMPWMQSQRPGTKLFYNLSDLTQSQQTDCIRFLYWSIVCFLR